MDRLSGRLAGFATGRLQRKGATAVTAEGAVFGAAEATANGEYGAEGVEGRVIGRLSSRKRVERLSLVLAVGSLFTSNLLPNELP